MTEDAQLSLGFGAEASKSVSEEVPPPAGGRGGVQDALDLRAARAAGLFSALDVHFAERLAGLYEEARPELRWLLALVCREEGRGHVCADLNRLVGARIAAETAAGETRLFPALPGGHRAVHWQQLAGESALVREVSAAEPARTLGGEAPLVLESSGRLYLRRAFEDQRTLAAALLERLARPGFEVDEARLGQIAATQDTAMDEATLAALRSGLGNPLSIVTGGPGTGKTTLVARMIGLAIEAALARGEAAPRVRLLAPTGKAAAAMTASFARGRERLDLSPAAAEALPASAETIHRALAGRLRRGAFGRSKPVSLDADIVVVDEASMVDLSLMRSLVEAAAPADRLILLGDPDQLASVDAGAVLAELCDAAGHVPALGRAHVRLEKSHRFAAGGAIGKLAEAIRAGDAEATLAVLDDPDLPEVSRRDVSDLGSVRAHLAEAARAMQREILAASNPDAKLGRLTSGRVLCAHRRGPLGSEALCEMLDAAAASLRRTTSQSGWWQGRLLLVTRNAPEQDLWNGDVGLIEEIEGTLRALFADGKGGVRSLSAGRLPGFESAIAMSVHKSQGSEFDRVELVLGQRVSELMTRELLYTGVTRARDSLCLHASEDVIRAALQRRVERDSGLTDLLQAEA